jgi:hypothetical protein
MPVPARLDAYIETEKQRHFSRDFMIGWENYETWEQATVGDSGPALRTFRIAEEDIVSYNRACGETDPLRSTPFTPVRTRRPARFCSTPSSSPRSRSTVLVKKA